MILTSADWIPAYQDAGYDLLIASIAPRRLRGAVAVEYINEHGSLPAMTVDMLARYVTDRHAAGALPTVQIEDHKPVTPTVRPAAPTGLGEDGVGVWFDAPDAGTQMVRWYKNGALIVEREQDLTTNRSITAEELGGILGGDVVQVCVVESGVVGWWGRIVMS
jgi:hypothetical protein